MGSENILPQVNNQNDLQLLLVGAFIAFISGNLIEIIKNWILKREKTKNFKLFVKLELQVIVKTLDKLQVGLAYGSIYDYNLLERAKESVGNLEKVRSDAIYLSDAELKEKFIDILSDVLTYVAQTKTVQDIFYNDQRSINESSSQKRIVKRNKKQALTETNPQPVTAKTTKDMWEDFNKRTTQRSIEYIDIKRRLEDFIQKLR